MNRRKVESTKYRKQFHFRKCKFAEGVYSSSTFLYLKFLLIWALIMLADFLLEFRFEFLWPFWLVIRSLHDSFKYQGIIFSIFFALVAFLSDFLCYMFLPVQWLFFAASTYVWVQYVWHTEKGICLPTISLWLLFVYIEASMRLKTLKTIDLCRPFAAHCIGYPMVTLGFGFKSYLGYKLRLKKQKEIQKQNEFHMQLIAKALPLELQLKDKDKFKTLNYDEEISNQQVLVNPTQGSIIGSLCNTSQQTSVFNNIKEKTAKPPAGHNNVSCCANASNSTGIIASALSFYLNGNNSSSSSNFEDLPYIQQKDLIIPVAKANQKNAKFNNYADPGVEQKSDYTYTAPNSSGLKTTPAASNQFNKPNQFNQTYTNAGKQLPMQAESIQSSVNCNLSTFSISAYSATEQVIGGASSSSNNNNTNSTGNVLVLSNSKHGGEGHHHGGDEHHRSSSTASSNTGQFLPTNSNNHTNININMTISTSAIAAATAIATSNTNSSSPNSAASNPVQTCAKTASNGGVANSNNMSSGKNKKNKESASSLHRANSVTSTASSTLTNQGTSQKDEIINRLEEDLKKVRDEIQQQKTVEQYLRNQINYVTKCDRTEKSKIEKLQQENKSLQAKMSKLSVQTQKEKDDFELMEKRLQEEKRARFSLETQLSQEKKLRESQEIQLQELMQKNVEITVKSDPAPINSKCNNRTECSADLCKKKLKEIEAENKKLAEELRKKQERILMLECDMKNLTKYRDTETRVDTLMVALNLMENKNASLQESLSAETRFKLDLFSALGETRRQLDSVTFQLKTKERELNAFKTIFKETLTASSSLNFSNNALSNYLNTTNDSNDLGNQRVLSSNSLSSNNSSVNGSGSSNQNENSNDWNSLNGGLSFIPKI